MIRGVWDCTSASGAISYQIRPLRHHRVRVHVQNSRRARSSEHANERATSDAPQHLTDNRYSTHQSHQILSAALLAAPLHVPLIAPPSSPSRTR